MGDVTMSESAFAKLQRAEARLKEIERTVREHGVGAVEKMGIQKLKAGEVREGLFHIGGANAPAIQSFLAGGAVFYLVTSDWFDSIKAVKEHWWLKPAVTLGVGYYLYRRGSSWSLAIISSGAALLIHGYNTRPKPKEEKKEEKKDGAATNAAAPPAPAADTKGFDDDAGWDWSGDTYGRYGRWVDTPHGARAYMTEGPGAYAAERMADRVFAQARA